MNKDQLQTFKTQIQEEFIGIKSDIMSFIKEGAPLNCSLSSRKSLKNDLKTDLDLIKQENKSLKGKLEFIKLVLKEINLNSYNKVINSIK